MSSGGYFDYNATSVPNPRLSQWVRELLVQGPLNPSSVHHQGRRARALVEDARRGLAEHLGVNADRLHFTSGATEAIYDFIIGTLKPYAKVLVNPLEHSAVFAALERVDARIDYMDVDRFGRINIEQFKDLKPDDYDLVVVMLANNEIGNIYPIQQICELVSPIPVFCDAVQALGKMPIDPKALGVAGLSLSAHKVGGLSGVGALWTREGCQVTPRTLGGAQERGRRGGTENLIGIATFGLLARELDSRIQSQQKLRGLQTLLRARLSDLSTVTLLGDPVNILPNTVAFRCAGVEGDLVIQSLDLEGYCLSTGSACSSGSIEASPVMLALGYSHAEARELVRISMGPETDENSVVRLADALVDTLKRVAE